MKTKNNFVQILSLILLVFALFISFKTVDLLFKEPTISNSDMIFRYSIILASIAVVTLTIESARVAIEKMNEKIFKLAYFDHLTNLRNKDKFLLDTKIALNTGTNYALAILDINNFNSINEMFGFEEGDEFLKYVAECVRETANDKNEITARTSADVFYMLLNYSTENTIDRKLDMLMHRISKYPEIRHINFKITSVCGIYKVQPDDESVNINLLMDRAKLAIKLHKGKCENIISYYELEMQKRKIRRSEIENEMNNALNERQFEVYLQPKYNVLTEKIAGAEALIRWNHPTKGLIRPDEFIPVFEENGFISEMDLYVLQEVCKFQQDCIKKGYNTLPISVNQSKLLLFQGTYIDKLRNVLNSTRINPNLLDVEITETLIFGNKDMLIKVLNSLHEMGITISMDDFGSGYSSLNTLKDIPIDIIKLDKGFFEEATDTEKGKEIVSSIIKMAKQIQIITLSEGIERIEQVEFLKKIGCDLIQGYYYAKPMKSDDFEKLAYCNEEDAIKM